MHYAFLLKFDLNNLTRMLTPKKEHRIPPEVFYRKCSKITILKTCTQITTSKKSQLFYIFERYAIGKFSVIMQPFCHEKLSHSSNSFCIAHAFLYRLSIQSTLLYLCLYSDHLITENICGCNIMLLSSSRKT